MTNVANTISTEAIVQPIIVKPDTPKKSTRKRKRGICFSPLPSVHEFDIQSPTTRRLELRRRNLDEVDDELILGELRARGKVKNTEGSQLPVTVSNKRYLKNCWKREMQEELASKGVNAHGDHEELSQRLQLLEKLRRRAQLRMSGLNPVPIKMNLQTLTNELSRRKITFDKTNIREMVEALEIALVKDTESRIYIEGYEFGRTIVSASNIVDENSMIAALKVRGVKVLPRKFLEKRNMLEKLIDEELESQLREALVLELQEEFERRSLKFEGSSDDKILKDMKGPVTRSKTESMKNARVLKTEESVESLTKSERDRILRNMFDMLFSSGVWKQDYKINDSRGNCNLM